MSYRPLQILIATGLCTIAIAGGAQATPMLFTATINTDQVTHKLFDATDYAKAPRPFYKPVCAKETPVSYSDAGGQAVFWYNPGTGVLKYAITYQGLSGSPIMAHFHIAETGKAGPIVQSICGMPPKDSKALGSSAPALDGYACAEGTSGFWSASYPLAGNGEIKLTTAAEKQALLDGKLYVNIHTCLNELGEARGQILPVSTDDD